MADKARAGLIILVFAVLGAGAYFYFFHLRASQSVQPPPQDVSARQEPQAVSPTPLIKLEQSDELIRGKSSIISSDPRFSAWLKADKNVWRTAAALNIIAEGDSPRESLSFMGPDKEFSVIKKKGRLFVDPRSYVRYDPTADVFQSMNVPAAAELFERLKPLFKDVCGELGCRSDDFRGTVVAAIQELLKTPLVQGDIRLKKKLKCYTIADRKLEQLSAAQKHLIRMGPENTAKIQAKLREMARALAVPEEQLPRTQTYKIKNR